MRKKKNKCEYIRRECENEGFAGASLSGCNYCIVMYDGISFPGKIVMVELEFGLCIE